MQNAILESCCSLFRKHFKNESDDPESELKKKSNSTFLLQSCVFLRRMKTKAFNCKQMLYPVGYLNVNCSFTLQKSLKMTAKTRKENNIWQFLQISEFHILLNHKSYQNFVSCENLNYVRKINYNFVGKKYPMFCS